MNEINSMLLTVYSNKDNSSGSIGNSVISSTSVATFTLSTDGQRHGDNTVIGKSCPRDGWCWVTISCTVEQQIISLIYCLVIGDLSDAWWTYNQNTRRLNSKD